MSARKCNEMDSTSLTRHRCTTPKNDVLARYRRGVAGLQKSNQGGSNQWGRDLVIKNKIDEALNYLEQEDYATAFESFCALIAEGVTDSRVYLHLGWLYQTGCGTEKNIAKAKEFYLKSAAAGEVLGDFYLGTIYRDEGLLDKAIEFFTRPAEKGHPSSAYWLSCMFADTGSDVINSARAKHYLELACQSGHVFAQRDRALAMLRGTFAQKQVLKGLIGLVKSYARGFYLAFTDPNSHKLR